MTEENELIIEVFVTENGRYKILFDGKRLVHASAHLALDYIGITTLDISIPVVRRLHGIQQIIIHENKDQ